MVLPRCERPCTVLLLKALIEASSGKLELNLGMFPMALMLHLTGEQWRVGPLFEELKANSEIVPSQ